jgi:hypothetical protein
MDWYKIALYQDGVSYSEPGALEREAQETYEQAGCPEGFRVFMEIPQNPAEGGNNVYYFSPVAKSCCSELFKSYRGSCCEDPTSSDRIVQLIP